MVAQKGTGQQSMNSGEFAPDLAGRVDIKQYYSAGLQFRNVEPVAQAGFRSLPGTRRLRPVGSPTPPRFWKLKRSRTETFFIAVLPGRLDIFKELALVATVPIAALTAQIAWEASLYLEADTIGIFHADLVSLRVVRVTDAIWTVDLWPYKKIPTVDYGEVYPKTTDIWILHIRSTDLAPYISVRVNGESTPAIGFTRESADEAIVFAAKLKTALEDLPSLGPSITVRPTWSNDTYATMQIEFGGQLAGSEYDVSGQVTNTSSASALAVHYVIGKTDGEPVISTARGWPGVVAIVQDRIIYGALKPKPSGLLFSQTAEYFNVNTDAVRDDGAKLEALRTNSKEEILHIRDSKYLLVFTDEAEYFATNRIVKRGEPLNFIETTRNGLARGTWPVEIENRVYYVGQRGGVLFSTAYDDISSAFTGQMESLLATHLIDDIVMTDLQRGTDETDAPRLWLLRSDGSLVGASVIRDQEITAFFRYFVGGAIRSIGVDGRNRFLLVVERAEGLVYEVMDETTNLFGGIDLVSSSTGVVSGIPYPGGSEVWAETEDGFTIGPFVVSAGAISTDWPNMRMRVGPWTPPVWESMPRVLVTGDDKIVRRPGRIHTLKVNIIDTTSIAIGANGTPPRDVVLLRSSDATDAPMPPKTDMVTAAGIPGFRLDTTATITQKRPGRLRVRDVTFEEKL